MAAFFDTFLFDTTLFDAASNPPGAASTVILTRYDWTAAINIGDSPLESDINPAAR